LKSSLTQHNPSIEIEITRSRSYEPYMTLRGSYQIVGNFLKLNAQLYNSADQPVGKAMTSEILHINLLNAEIEPSAELIEVATRLQEIVENKPTLTPESRESSVPSPVNSAELRFEMSTNKGNGPQTFTENDTMTVLVRVNKPCLLRLVYRDAANNLLLMGPDIFKINEYQINSWVEIPDNNNRPQKFVCSAPFGIEMLLGFATTGLFESLDTKKEQGFTIIKDDLKKVKEASATLQEMKNIVVAERFIQITTRAKK
ncbi:DUF4384 domain-containing protein, partial [Runella sp.]|uniref:DUF4384 domain-containing protein n=1 Tax=Runella sp. TaxID=1960881 RepID=UPI00301B3B64